MVDTNSPVTVPLTDEALDREILEFLGKGKRKSRGNRLLGLALLPVKGFVLVVLPFWVLVRGAVFAHLHWALNPWLALVFGMVAGSVVLTIYGSVISKKLTGKVRLRVIGTRVVAPAVIAFCVYSLVYLSSANAKTPEVRAYYRSVHPLLRIAASTIILVDSDVMITGLGRSREDYARMGLDPRESSLHYEQSDGFVHAMDMRTIGRGRIRNSLTDFYFRAMGFATLRHVGTADHLHVSLPVR